MRRNKEETEMKTDETVREVCEKYREIVPEHATCLDYSPDEEKDFLDSVPARIAKANESAMEAKDEMICIAVQSAQARFDEAIAAKDAEIARLRAALKPVMACEVKPNAFGYITERARISCIKAVVEAQRVMRESTNGESH